MPRSIEDSLELFQTSLGNIRNSIASKLPSGGGHYLVN